MARRKGWLQTAYFAGSLTSTTLVILFLRLQYVASSSNSSDGKILSITLLLGLAASLASLVVKPNAHGMTLYVMGGLRKIAGTVMLLPFVAAMLISLMPWGGNLAFGVQSLTITSLLLEALLVVAGIVAQKRADCVRRRTV
jgi:hypothetical protein